MRSSSSFASTLLFLDTAVPNYESLMRGVRASVEMILLDCSENGIVQITQELAGRSCISSLHMIFRGSEGCLKLGSAELNAQNLDAYGWELQQWGDALTPGAEILLHVAGLATGDIGQNFVRGFGLLIGATVGVSQHVPDADDFTPPWNLSFATGPIQSRSPFKSRLRTVAAGV